MFKKKTPQTLKIKPNQTIIRIQAEKVSMMLSDWKASRQQGGRWWKVSQLHTSQKIRRGPMLWPPPTSNRKNVEHRAFTPISSLTASSIVPNTVC